jgi:hypothetical protein
MTSRMFIHYGPIVIIRIFSVFCSFNFVSQNSYGKHFRNWPFARPRRLRAGRQEVVFRFRLEARTFFVLCSVYIGSRTNLVSYLVGQADHSSHLMPWSRMNEAIASLCLM